MTKEEKNEMGKKNRAHGTTQTEKNIRRSVTEPVDSQTRMRQKSIIPLCSRETRPSIRARVDNFEYTN